MSAFDWKKLLEWSEEEIQNLRFVGYSYIKQGHYEIAKLLFETLLIVTKPNENEYDLQTLGAIYLQLGNYLNSLNYFEKALKLNPNHAPTLLNRAKALLLLGYKSSGIQAAKALTLHPNQEISSQASALLLAYS